MYYYEPDNDGERAVFIVRDENGNTVAIVPVEADAKEIVAALNLVERAQRDFPGIVDGETEVSAADLLDLVNESLCWDENGRFYERAGLTPCPECDDGHVVCDTCDICGERHCGTCEPCEEGEAHA